MSGFPSSIGGLGGHGHGGDRDLWIERLPSPPPTPAPPEASLTTQERLRLAKRRRAAQLKRWTQRDMAKGASAAGAPDIIQGRTRSGHSVETKLDMYQRVSWNISWQKGCPPRCQGPHNDLAVGGGGDEPGSAPARRTTGGRSLPAAS